MSYPTLYQTVHGTFNPSQNINQWTWKVNGDIDVCYAYTRDAHLAFNC